jgi:hypothetical protein
VKGHPILIVLVGLAVVTAVLSACAAAFGINIVGPSFLIGLTLTLFAVLIGDALR